MCTKPSNCAKKEDLSELGMQVDEKDMQVIAMERTREYARSLAEATDGSAHAVVLLRQLSVFTAQ